MDRRTFIKRSLLATGAAGAAGAAALGFDESEALVPPRAPLHVLDETSFGVLVAMAARIVPVEGADPVQIAHDVDASLRYTTPEAGADTRLVLAVLENGLSGLLTRGSATLFSELTPEGRDEALRRWGDSSIAMLRGATNSLRKLCLGVHYASLEHARALGYPGPIFEKPDPGPLSARAAISKPFVAQADAEAPESGEESP